jgi:UDP-glucose 4-epimerase
MSAQTAKSSPKAKRGSAAASKSAAPKKSAVKPKTTKKSAATPDKSKATRPTVAPKAAKPAKTNAAAQAATAALASSQKKPRVLITGISGRLGRLLAQHLHRVAEVHGVDRRPFVGCPKDVVMHHIDLRKKRCEDLFRSQDYQAVYHLGVVHNPRISVDEHHSFNVTGTMKILEYCARYKVPKVVLLSSATIYGPHPNNPAFLTEEAPLLAGQRFPQIRDLIELDMLAQSFFWKHTEIETVILRPVQIVGPHIRNAFSNYLRLARIPKLIGFDPMIQIIHEQDMVEALVLAMQRGVAGIFNIAGPSAAPLSRMISELGKKSLPVPHPLAKAIMAKLWQFKLSDFPAPEVDYARFICTVDGSRAERVMGFKARFSLRETVRSLLE